MAGRMLELKKAFYSNSNGVLFSDLNIFLNDGEMLSISGAPHSGRTSLLKIIMGYIPLTSGLVSIDGELVTTTSAIAFRRMMAFAPGHLDSQELTVEELVRLPFSLKANRSITFTKGRVIEAWQKLGLEPSLYESAVADLTPAQRQLILIADACLLGKRLILVDDLLDPKAVALLRHTARTDRSSVVIVSNDAAAADNCDKHITLLRQNE